MKTITKKETESEHGQETLHVQFAIGYNAKFKPKELLRQFARSLVGRVLITGIAFILATKLLLYINPAFADAFLAKVLGMVKGASP